MNQSTKGQMDVDTGHDYDGIKEFDNPLPNWWLAIFIVTVLFGYGYWMHYHVAKTGPSLAQELAQEQAEVARRNAASKPMTDELLVALSKDPISVGAGEQVFKTNCASCHGDRLEGKIGPNLTDKYWLHGSRPTDIHKTITQGVVEKGMPAWGPVLGAERVRNVVAFVLTKKDTNVPGKEPQGTVATLDAAR